MNFIDERDERTKKRKTAKAKFDEKITLSSNKAKGTVMLSASVEGGKVRLLDEGTIVYADGSPDFYIMRGTIEKYLNGQNELLTDREGNLLNLTDDYVGSINIGHLDFATFPVGIVGEWTKTDLTLIDTEDGRHGLDVDVRLWKDHPLVKALAIQGIPVGVSVEMYLRFNEEASYKIHEVTGLYMNAVDEIFISDFAIVGECGNVGSSETLMKGGESVKDEKNLTIEEIVEEIAEEGEIVEETTDETTEETTEDYDGIGEEDEVEETIEEDSEEDEDEETDELAQVMESINQLRAEVETLRSENEALKKTNKRLSKKLQAELDRKKSFVANFPSLTVDMGLSTASEDEKKEESITRYASNDGIGE